MKKNIFLIPFFYCFFAFSIDEVELRKRFYQSVESVDVAKKLIYDLNKSSDSNVLNEGYKAATMMVMAKHVINPFSKLKYFKDGKKILENVIKNSPENLELRLIRFAIQTNVPQFLGYNNEIINDKNLILKKCTKLDVNLPNQAQLKLIIKQYLYQSEICSESELASLN